MIDLSGHAGILANGHLSVHTDTGGTMALESRILYTTRDGTTRELNGDDPHLAAMALVPLLVGCTNQSATVNATDGLILTTAHGVRFTAPPDEEFEAWNIVGPRYERVISTPGGELAVGNAVP